MKDQTTRRDLVTAGASSLLLLKPQTVRGAQANSALSVGLIGCGRRGTYVSGLFTKNEFAKISALCDIYDDQLEAATKKFSGAKTFKNYHDLLASDVDAVYIATPPYLHPEHFEAAVKARKHIFMEKPAGVDPAGCRQLVAAAKQADKTKRISVDYQQRYGKDYRRAYQIVQSGELGGIKMVRASWLGGGLPVREGVASNEEQNCHNLDVVNWFMGTHPVRAFGYGGRQVRNNIGNILDNLAATFHFENGVIFSYSANQFSTGGFSDVSETFICERGAVTTSRRGYKLYRSKDAPPEEVSTT